MDLRSALPENKATLICTLDGRFFVWGASGLRRHFIGAKRAARTGQFPGLMGLMAKVNRSGPELLIPGHAERILSMFPRQFPRGSSGRYLITEPGCPNIVMSAGLGEGEHGEAVGGAEGNGSKWGRPDVGYLSVSGTCGMLGGSNSATGFRMLSAYAAPKNAAKIVPASSLVHYCTFV